MRTRIVPFRLTDREYERMVEEAQKSGEKSISAYLRSILFVDAYAEVKKHSQEEELIRQIRKIGVNINQIVARFNSELYFQSDKQQLKAQMERLLELMEGHNGETGNDMERNA